jgi:hypothetical protein
MLCVLGTLGRALMPRTGLVWRLAGRLVGGVVLGLPFLDQPAAAVPEVWETEALATRS